MSRSCSSVGSEGERGRDWRVRKALTSQDVLVEALRQQSVEVTAAQARLTEGEEHLMSSILNSQQRHVARAAADIDDENGLLAGHQQAVAQGRGCRLDQEMHLTHRVSSRNR